MPGMENAKMATIIPIIAQTTAFLAVVIFAGSPCAVTNMNPAKISMIMEAAKKTGQITSFNKLFKISWNHVVGFFTSIVKIA